MEQVRKEEQDIRKRGGIFIAGREEGT